ncbi:unnamed protein product, partial [Didymodactylos carnosus]
DSNDVTTAASVMVVTEQNYKELLQSTLDDAECINAYCAGGNFEYLCDLRLDGFNTIDGILHLPLTDDSAHLIINKCTRPTITKDIEDDASLIADRWELSPSFFSINNLEWNSKLMEDLNSKIPIDLGLNDEWIKQNQLNINLTKLVLYGKGLCSKPYKIEDEQNGVLAKLIVVLPSTYEGGQDYLINKKEKYVFDFSKNSKNSLHYIVCFNNCEHEIHRVTNGYKLTLVYDIDCSSTLIPTMYLNPTRVDEQLVQQMNEILLTWLRHSNGASKLIIPLTGLYAKSDISSLSLNSKDRAYTNLLLESIKRFRFSSDVCHHLWPHDEFLLYFGTLKHEQELYEDGDVMDDDMFVDNLIQLNEIEEKICKQVWQTFKSIKKVDVNEEIELINRTLYDRLDRTFDHENMGTGNQIFSYPKIGVLMLVPYHRKYELLFDDVQELYNKQFDFCWTLQHNYSSKLKSIILKKECLESIDCLLMTEHMLGCNVTPIINRLITLFKTKTENIDVDRSVMAIIQRLIKHRWFSIELLIEEHLADDIFELGNLIGWQIIGIDLSNSLQKAVNHPRGVAFLIAFVSLVNQTKQQQQQSTKNDLFHLIMCMINTLLKQIFKQKQIFETTPMKTVCSLLELLSLFDDTYLLSLNIISKQMINFMNKCHKQNDDIIQRFFEPAFIPLIKKLWSTFFKQQNIPRWFIDLYEYCLSVLNYECNLPPPPLKKWPLDELNINCDCNYCQQLLTFLLDQNKIKTQFIKSRRFCSQFARTIDQFSTLLTPTIQHNGSEQQLEITKPFDTKKQREKCFMLRDGIIEINITKYIYALTTNPRITTIDDNDKSPKRLKIN